MTEAYDDRTERTRDRVQGKIIDRDVTELVRSTADAASAYIRGDIRSYLIVPEPRGIDSSGREVLAYIEGRDQGAPFIPEILADDGAERLGQLAARLRAALSRYPCPPDARWQFADGPPGPGQAVQHGDLGPWNLLWGGDRQIVGVLDWD